MCKGICGMKKMQVILDQLFFVNKVGYCWIKLNYLEVEWRLGQLIQSEVEYCSGSE